MMDHSSRDEMAFHSHHKHPGNVRPCRNYYNLMNHCCTVLNHIVPFYHSEHHHYGSKISLIVAEHQATAKMYEYLYLSRPVNCMSNTYPEPSSGFRFRPLWAFNSFSSFWCASYACWTLKKIMTLNVMY